MKYYKIIDGVRHESDCSVIQLPNGQWVSNPTPAKIAKSGWLPIEDTPTVTLAEARANKLSALAEYDSSDNVNQFYFKGNGMWIGPNERANYLNTLLSAERLSISNVNFLGYTLPVYEAIHIIDMINIYAMECVKTTDFHREAITSIDTVEGINNYNFTTGYPEKLSF